MIIKFQAQVRTQTTLGKPSIASVGTPQLTEDLAWDMIRKQAARLYPKSTSRQELFVSHGLVVPVLESGDGQLAQAS